MRVSTSTLMSFVAFAAANPSDGPPDGAITLNVGAGSSLEGYQVVGFASDGTGFPELVPAAEANESLSTWQLKYWNFGHFGWYAITSAIDGTTYQLDIEHTDDPYTGSFVFNPQTDYYSSDDIWSPKTASPDFPWFGNPENFAFGCTRDDGHIQLGIYSPNAPPKNCEQVKLEYQLIA
ncbi:hypothetical protein NPX13_g5382 [Xylaria arbuscula]|uniref:Uncharacterized protein n=1 Tax=Xylaria arbuscula TaxID=114810 RepID=A0A9W8NEY0_9PEZI|nr:hypothetical protein NPX13_g5382 [Xylaria arbuscula]